MREIPVVDTTLRDAHQCLWATRMTTAHMLPIAERMDKMGFQRIDLAGTIQFDVCIRYLKENPWERVRLMRERITQTPLSSFTRSKNIVSFDVVPMTSLLSGSRGWWLTASAKSAVSTVSTMSTTCWQLPTSPALLG